MSGVRAISLIIFSRKLPSTDLQADFISHFHRFKVISRHKVVAEGRYPMIYVDRRCWCGEYKGIYI